MARSGQFVRTSLEHFQKTIRTKEFKWENAEKVWAVHKIGSVKPKRQNLEKYLNMTSVVSHLNDKQKNDSNTAKRQKEIMLRVGVEPTTFA